MPKDFTSIVSSIGLPKELEVQLLEAWNDQVEANRQDVAAEMREESKAQLDEEVKRIVDAAETLTEESLKVFAEQIDAKFDQLKEAKIKLAKRAKRLREAEEINKQHTTKLMEMVADVLNKEITNLNEANKEQESLLEAERIQLMREKMSVSKKNDAHMKALIKMNADILNSELQELKEDRDLNKKRVDEAMEKLSQMAENILKEEMEELHQDRVSIMEANNKLQDMTVGILTKELTELHEDRVEFENKSKQLDEQYEKEKEAFFAEQKVKLAESVERITSKVLTSELTALKDDIQEARENRMGRAMFETFSAQFATMFFNENKEIQKIAKELNESQENIKKMQKIIAENEETINNSKKELRESQEKHLRERKIGELTKSLSGTHKEVMEQYLATTETSKLEETFKRVLPRVLNESPKQVTTNEKKTRLAESTGSRKQEQRKKLSESIEDNSDLESDAEIAKILMNAGLDRKKN